MNTRAKQSKYFDILAAKKAYAEGKNITELLRSQKNSDFNTSEIIETAYDLQAGTYIKYAANNPQQADLYTAELASILDKHIKPTDSLLDIGTGELTTLSSLMNNLSQKPATVHAFDISWSRIFKGMTYAKEKMAPDYHRLTPFVADIGEIPLFDKSINITTSSHALEPNGGRLKELMGELFRVTIDKLVLFEPCFEINNEEGKQRMDKLGYIKNVADVVKELGGTMIDRIAIKNTANPLNPTACFIIEPPTTGQSPAKNSKKTNLFSAPGSNFSLDKIDNFFFSNQTGLCYPILKNVPILKSNAAVLASALSN